jgi:hypothetical protein
MLSVDGGDAIAMARSADNALWTAPVDLSAGLHRIEVSAGTDRDAIQVLVRSEQDIPRRGMPVAPGHDVHSVGAWPEHGLAGTQLGPNKNGKHW